jgi:beta-lactamase class D
LLDISLISTLSSRNSSAPVAKLFLPTITLAVLRQNQFDPTLLFIANCGLKAAHAQDLSGFFKGTQGAFVLYDLKNNRYVRYNEQRCREQFSPKSTFKIPNSLIGLETGVIRDAELVIQWDSEKYPPQADWNQEPFIHWGKDQTLRSAIKYSVLWYYRELALRVGDQQMKKYVTAFDYGNKDCPYQKFHRPFNTYT